MTSSSDEFSGRLGLIFATIGAAIGTGNIWRFPRMVGANGGGSFLVPWVIFLFLWSIPLVVAEFALGKRSRTGTVGNIQNFQWSKICLDGAMDCMDIHSHRILLCCGDWLVHQLFPERCPRRFRIGCRYN